MGRGNAQDAGMASWQLDTDPLIYFVKLAQSTIAGKIHAKNRRKKTPAWPGLGRAAGTAVPVPPLWQLNGN
jgi:hypothetical protein